MENKGLMVVASKDGVEYTVYRTGKLLIHPMDKDLAKGAADDFYPLCVESAGDGMSHYRQLQAEVGHEL